MKKLIGLFTSLVLCLSIAMPAFAAENGFVPSITYKPNPEIVTVKNEAGEEFIGVIRNDEGEIINYVEGDSLTVTPVAYVWDDEKEASEDTKSLLLAVYNSLSNGEMKIPYEKHEAGLNAANMVIRDLFDVSWSNEEYKEMVEAAGTTFEITFDLGIVSDVEVYVMTMDESTREWSPIVKTVNNGDGTVTCTFEHLCPIEFSVAVEPVSAPVDGTPVINYIPWVIVLVLAAGGILFLALKKRNRM